MSGSDSSGAARSVLVVGASRGLGLAMAAEFAQRRWSVVGTVRSPGGPLEALAQRTGLVEIEPLDMTHQDQVLGLAERLSGRVFDIVFVNAGVVNPRPSETLAQVSTEDFLAVMTTNVLGVMRAVEALAPLARPGGVVGVMSSGQGSIANNTNGANDVYRASKAALNQAMASFAGRHPERPVLLLAPGWIRTDLGGSNAPLTVEEAMPQIVDVMVAQQDRLGLKFLDRHGKTVLW